MAANKRQCLGESDEELIPNVLNEVAFLCLIRVPRIYHGTMKQVSRLWRKTIDARYFYEERKKLGFAEEFIMLLPFECHGYDREIQCLEMDPTTGRVSSPITYTMSPEESESWEAKDPDGVYLARGSRFQGLGDRVFVVGFDISSEIQPRESMTIRPPIVVVVDVLDRTMKLTPRIPHYIDILYTDDAIIDGKLWLSTREHTYDVYDPEHETWTADVQKVPPGWLFYMNGACDVSRVLGCPCSDALWRNMEDQEIAFELRDSFYHVTSRGLFMVGLYQFGNPDGDSGAAVYKLDTSAGKKTTGQVWTNVWSRSWELADMFWKNKCVAMNDYVLLGFPDEPDKEIKLEEVSPDLKLLFLPLSHNWKIARLYL